MSPASSRIASASSDVPMGRLMKLAEMLISHSPPRPAQMRDQLDAALAWHDAVAQAARVETAIDHGVIHVPARPATPAPSAAIGMGKMHILSFKMLHDAL